jgi:methionyl-tRNA synthetase
MSSISHFITTAIPYVNSKPHIGHAQEFALADALARYYRQKGGHVLLQSGTDDNATKNVLAAKAVGATPKDFVETNSRKFRDLLKSLGISEDIFVRTSTEKHFKSVHHFLEKISKDDIFESKYTGLYCSGCEDFYNEKDLENGLCPDHQKKPETIEEKNIFFRLSKYQSQILELIKSDKIKITPSSKKNEILRFIEQGLSDISLSRSATRTQGWGVPFPNVENQTVYVWIDALINYISGAGYGNSNDWLSVWSEDVYKVHVIGKNVWKFHAIYWPALLLSANLPLPNEIVIHGFLTNDGIKISKSLDNGADPIDVINRYGSDAVRFYLLSILHFEQDADFIENNLVESYNSELANKFGNLASRILTLSKSVNLKTVPPEEKPEVKFRDIRSVAFSEISRVNAEINHTKPWDLLKNKDPEVENILSSWIADLKYINFLIEPITPVASQKLEILFKTTNGVIPQLFPRY